MKFVYSAASLVISTFLTLSTAQAAPNAGAPNPQSLPSLQNQFEQQRDADDAGRAAAMLGVPATAIVDYKVERHFSMDPSCRYVTIALVKLNTGRIEKVEVASVAYPERRCLMW